MARSADGTVTFSDAPIRNGRVLRTAYSSRIVTTGPVRNPCKGLTHQALDARVERLESQFALAAREHGVDIALLKAVAHAESCFDAYAISRAGAKGMMQLMPATARQMGVQNIFDQRENLMGGARYLARMLARYANKQDLALAAYNAGPGNVDKYKGVPPFKETRRYVKAVNKYHKQYSASVLASTTD